MTSPEGVLRSRAHGCQRVVVAVAVLGLVALSAACSSTTQAGGPGTTARATGSIPPRASFAAAPCPTVYPGAPQFDVKPGSECGYLTVPEDRSKPDGRTIRLLVVRMPSASPSPKSDPVVYLAGGPGAPPFFSSAPKEWAFDRDVILLTQRGTMLADPHLTCAETDAFYAQDVSIGAQAPSASEMSSAAAGACRDRLTKDGWDLAAYDTAADAADVADLRVALGLQEYNLYGVSYGTNLALQVLRDHPEGVRSLILDSVLPPQVDLVESGWTSAASSYDAIFTACAAQAACVAAYPNVRQELTTLVNELSAHPRTVAYTDPNTGTRTDVVIDGFQLASGVVVAAAQNGGLAEVPKAIHDLAVGDGSLAAAILVQAPSPPNVISWGLQLGVACGEWMARTSGPRIKEVGKAALPDFPEAVVSLPAQIPFVPADCAAWKMPAASPSASQPTSSDVPVLMGAGTFDSATPPAYAAEAAKTLPNAVNLTFPGAGHGLASDPASKDCFTKVMASFLDRPVGFDHSCVQTLQIPAFTTG